MSLLVVRGSASPAPWAVLIGVDMEELSLPLLQGQGHLGHGAGRHGDRRSDGTIEVQHFVGTLIQLGEHGNELLSTADCAWPYPGMDAGLRTTFGTRVDLVADEVIPHAGHVHDDGADIVADVEHHRTTGRRGFPRRPVVVAVVMPMIVAMSMGVLMLGFDAHAVTKAVRSRTR